MDRRRAEWDWDSFYREADYDRCTYLAGEEMVAYLERFLEQVGMPEALADVGCGPGVVLFELAERYPDTGFYGYDVSETVTADNAALARERGLGNLQFAVGALPDPGIGRQFDLVYCVATLYFVERPRRALQSLYGLVRPGGHLVVNYPTEETRRVATREFEGRKRDAFGLVIEGRNLLTAEEIAETLDATVRDYWAAVDADHGRGEWATVYVGK